jgi:hypothetical protein
LTGTIGAGQSSRAQAIALCLISLKIGLLFGRAIVAKLIAMRGVFSEIGQQRYWW